MAPLLTAFLLLADPGRADVFHLNTGGTIEGQLLAEDDDQYKIRSTVGLVLLPKAAVERVESAPTIFEEYDRRREAAGGAADDQVALGQWCEEHGLTAEARRHFEQALELDPNHATARRALGYVRVNGLWLDGRSMSAVPPTTTQAAKAPPPAEAAAQPPDREQLKQAIQGQWRRRIRAIRNSLLESSLERLQRDGREQIERIHDPLAILPLTQELSAGDVATRQLLVETLGRFDEDEATMNLAVIALIDPSETIRHTAVTVLKRRSDPRVIAQYREALRSDSDVILRRAAFGLGELGAAAALDDLVEVLTARRVRWVEVPVRRYFDSMPRVFAGGARVSLGPADDFTVVHYPQIGVAGYANDVENAWRKRPVTVFRTEVLEALKKITGQNFGFERDDWRAWLRETES